MRALGFCVSVAHAAVHGRGLQRRGHPGPAVLGDTPADDRADALDDLRDRRVNVLFTVDLFNEGVDLPASTRCCSFDRPRARRSSSSSSAGACVARRTRQCSPRWTSSVTTARSSASTPVPRDDREPPGRGSSATSSRAFPSCRRDARSFSTAGQGASCWRTFSAQVTRGGRRCPSCVACASRSPRLIPPGVGRGAQPTSSAATASGPGSDASRPTDTAGGARESELLKRVRLRPRRRPRSRRRLPRWLLRRGPSQ